MNYFPLSAASGVLSLRKTTAAKQRRHPLIKTNTKIQKRRMNELKKLKLNPATTPPKIDRGTWLAMESQARRRKRAGQSARRTAPVLAPTYPSQLTWTWNLANPYKWNVWISLDGGTSFTLLEDYWALGDARQFAPDGGHNLYFVVGVDASGNEITERSNVVRPDDAPAPPAAPVLIDAGYSWNSGSTVYADIEVDFSFDHGSYPPADMEVWSRRDGNEFTLLFNVSSLNTYFTYEHATESEVIFDFKIRYVNGSVQGPFSNVLSVEVQV